MAGTQYVSDVCRSDNGGMTQAPDAVGAPNACFGTDPAPQADPVYLYLTTNASAGTGGNTFMQPTGASSTNGLNLTAPLVIAGTARSKFVVNATGKVDGAFATCGMNPRFSASRNCRSPADISRQMTAIQGSAAGRV